jgi:pimeloyl-ACP methyl ester carboxylesterase/tellurite resistance protein
MNAGKMPDHQVGFTPSFRFEEYLVDRFQRNILFWDILRKRGNNYLDHLEAGQPPILIFDYEMVIDGKNFPKPVNYSMVRIIDRRRKKSARVSKIDDRRTTKKGEIVDNDGLPSRPIVIIDPRAGHGPGIGGSKLDSQIGIALELGHPVYFVLFAPDPEKNQTLVDVHQAEIKFLEKIIELHPDAPRPAVVGNCQAGWAAALIGADRPDLTGPLIFNGSPLSYWGGTEGRNPMRYRGGLYGGTWLTSLSCDLGNGKFDGAHLVAGFEDLNPANTFWTKYRHLFNNIDTEEKRFLDFERWWSGFYRMSSEEIHYIVDRLFIGNELEQGKLWLEDGRLIDMKNIRSPVFAFASEGDNITPPPQALNWIKKVYGTVDEIKRCNQIIIYMVHQKVGHLGIFVSGSVARKEHRQILGNLGWLEYLQPGLYEMVIDEPPSHPKQEDWRVRFVERDMEDIFKPEDNFADNHAFEKVYKVSRFNDAMYSLYLRPWIRLAMNEPLADIITRLHPLRMQRYLISDMNPLLVPVKMLAEQVKINRQPAADDNPFVAFEEICSRTLEFNFNLFRDFRDRTQEYLFKSFYDNPFTTAIFGEMKPESEGAVQVAEKNGSDREKEKIRLRQLAEKGGFIEACIRVMTAVSGRDRIIDVREFQVVEQIIQGNAKLKVLTPGEFKVIVMEQANILAVVPQQAIRALRLMPLSQKERSELIRIAEMVAKADGKTIGKDENKILASLRQVLQKKNKVPIKLAKKQLI